MTDAELRIAIRNLIAEHGQSALPMAKRAALKLAEDGLAEPARAWHQIATRLAASARLARDASAD